MITIEQSDRGPGGEHLSRMAARAEKQKQRHTLRNTVLMVVGVLVLGALVSGLVVLLTSGGGGLRAPGVVGMTYRDAKKKVEGQGFGIAITPFQDSSGVNGMEKLKVEGQDPKPGTVMESGDQVVVTLKGLRDAPPEQKSSGSTSNPSSAGPAAQAAAATQAPAPAPAAASGHTVCIDPGHSNRSGNETDSATGLNVGDNEGAGGEVQTMWDLAQRVKARLEASGYRVVLTKDSADSYASLRQRADTGNSAELVVRLHYDDTGYTGVMRPPANAARAPQSDPGRITLVDAGVAAQSDRLARDIASSIGLSVKDDTGGTSNGNITPSGHPTCLIGSCLSRVPVVCIENSVSAVRDNPGGQDQVAGGILQGIDNFFAGR